MQPIKIVRWLLVVLISTLLLHGCSCRFPVSIRGSLDGGIVFDLEGESRDVNYVSVSTIDKAYMSEDLWKLEGEGEVVTLRYGQAPPKGLSQIVAAQRLERNRLYHYSLEEDGFWAPCVGSGSFVVNDDGTVEECGTEECTKRFR